MQNTAFLTVSPRQLKRWLHDGDEIALLDVREAGQFGEGHLFLATPLPYSRLELEIGRLVPRLKTRMVLVDDSGMDVAVKAVRRLAALGYGAVHVLEGGMNAWAQEGFEVFAGVNVPSKAFGELAELHFGTPHISATELASKLERGEPVVILDGRPIPEYRKMSIPQASCCPNGELSRHIDDLVPDATTPVVINCAGRTRSIVGAQTLLNLGISNPVYALENGTQGWYLNDLKLEHGADRVFTASGHTADLSDRVQRAQSLADRFAIPRVTASTLTQWLAEADRTTYLCDVRTPGESQNDPIPGAQPTPGGQLIQATDQYVATRGARLVLVDGDDIRAPVVATWLYMLGWHVSVLPASEVRNLGSDATQSATTSATLSGCETIGAHDIAKHQTAGVPILDLRSGMQYRQSHIAGSIWTIRPVLSKTLGLMKSVPDTVVLICAEPGVATLAAQDLREIGVQTVLVCEQDMNACEAAGLPLESTPAIPSDADCIDYLFFVHDRHDGNKQAARQYLAWETNLISQLDDQEKAMFRFTPHTT